MEAAELYKNLLGIGLGKGHSSALSRGVREPGLPLAIKIFRELGIKLGPLRGMSKSEINALERAGVKRLATDTAA